MKRIFFKTIIVIFACVFCIFILNSVRNLMILNNLFEKNERFQMPLNYKIIQTINIKEKNRVTNIIDEYYEKDNIFLCVSRMKNENVENIKKIYYDEKERVYKSIYSNENNEIISDNIDKKSVISPIYGLFFKRESYDYKSILKMCFSIIKSENNCYRIIKIDNSDGYIYINSETGLIEKIESITENSVSYIDFQYEENCVTEELIANYKV